MIHSFGVCHTANEWVGSSSQTTGRPAAQQININAYKRSRSDDDDDDVENNNNHNNFNRIEVWFHDPHTRERGPNEDKSLVKTFEFEVCLCVICLGSASRHSNLI